MGKHDAPLFKMMIEGGRLVPATAFDAERLDSYRRGTRVNVRFTEEKDRVLVRKWWAVLGLVVKQCDVPWTNKEQASEAIKLALGIVNLTKTVGGKFMQYPKSLTELDDPELQEAVDQMMALIERMTGIDPDTLRKEAADVGADDRETSSDAPSSDENGSGDPAPDAAAGESSDQESGQSEEAGDDNAPAAEPDPTWLPVFAKVMVASIGPDEGDIVHVSKGLFKEGLTDDQRARARKIVDYCRQVARKEIERDDAVDIIAGIAGVEAGGLVNG
jgi:hypothetical protein